MGNFMTPEEFADRMVKIATKKHDEEERHIEADKLMCEALRELGYSEGAQVFEDMPKWCA